jgi:hypothetical protein
MKRHAANAPTEMAALPSPLFRPHWRASGKGAADCMTGATKLLQRME